MEYVVDSYAPVLTTATKADGIVSLAEQTLEKSVSNIDLTEISPNYKGKHPKSKEELARIRAEKLAKKDNLYESKDKMVSHPAHYQAGGIEVIDVIKAFTKDLNGIKATDTGNIIKYACRWNAKGKPIQDVEKIIWYATHLLRELQAEQESIHKLKNEENT